ncbi:TPA: hypothetical protein ACGPA6_002017 [Streptococcus suis]
MKKYQKQLLSSFLILTLASAPLSSIPQVLAEEGVATTQQAPNQAFLKVAKSSGIILYHQKLQVGQIVQIVNFQDEILTSEELTTNLDLTVPDLEIPEGKILSYWALESIEGGVRLKPILVEAQQGTLQFNVSGEGYLVKDNAKVKDLAITFTKGEPLEKYLPEIAPAENMKLSGWFIDEKKVNPQKHTLEEGISVIAKFYKDVNNNEIDDSTESATVKFVTNSDIKIADLGMFVGNYVELPILKQDNKIFMGWFSDENLSNKFDNNKLITKDITLFAKWEEAEKLINDSQNQKITDPLISKQLEEILNNVNELNAIVKDKNETIRPNVPSANSGKTTTTTTQKPSTSVSQNTVTPQAENVPQVLTPEVPEKEKEIKYVFSNPNVGKKHMLKFQDENEEVLFTMMTPYGQTVRIYNTDNQKIKEYGVRQNTTILLDSKVTYLTDSTKIDYYTKDTIVNDRVLMDIMPIVKKDESKDTYTQKSELKKDKKSSVWFIFGIGLTLIALGIVGFVLYITKKDNILKKIRNKTK